MFVSDDRGLPVSFAVASSRLEELARGRLLDGPSERVYHGGVETCDGSARPGQCLVRRGWWGPVHQPGAPRRRDGGSAAMGGYRVDRRAVPALDADIQLTDDGGDRTRVTLTGSYRPPLGALGDRLDRILLRAVALATIKALLTQIAAALEGAPAEASDPGMLWLPGLGPEPAPG